MKDLREGQQSKEKRRGREDEEEEDEEEEEKGATSAKEHGMHSKRKPTLRRWGENMIMKRKPKK